MPTVVHTMKLMGYTPDEKGVCFGMAVMSAQASLRKEGERFCQRINKIHNASNEDIQTLLKNENISSSQENNKLLQLQNFFDELSIYHGPISVNDNFKKVWDDYNQDISNLERLSPNTDSCIDVQDVLPKVNKIISNIFTTKDFYNLANELKAHLKGEPFSIIVIDSFVNHACNLGFDGKKWIFTNHDDVGIVEDTKEELEDAIKHIFNHFDNDTEVSKPFVVNVVLGNNSKTTLTNFQHFDFKPEKITDKTSMELVSQMILNCTHTNDNILLKNILIKIKSFKNLSPDDLAKIINYRNTKTGSALFMASQYGHTEIVDVLLGFIKELKVDLHTKMNMIRSKIRTNESALFIAAANGHIDAVNKILNAISELDINENAKFIFIESAINKSLLSIIAQEGNNNTFKTILNFIKKLKIDSYIKADLLKDKTNDNLSPLFLATLKGNENMVKSYLDALDELDVNESIKFSLIKAELSINSPFAMAAQRGHTQIIEMLLKFINKLNISDIEKLKEVTLYPFDGNSLLFISLLKGYNAIFAMTMDFINNLNITNEEKTKVITSLVGDKVSLLILAANNGNNEAIKLLLNTAETLKINPNWIISKDGNNVSALYFAAQNGHIEVVKTLINAIKNLKIDNKEKINEISSNTNSSKSILVAAAENGHSDILKILYDTIKELDHEKYFHEDWTRL